MTAPAAVIYGSYRTLGLTFSIKLAEHPRLLVPPGCSSLRRVAQLLRGPGIDQLQVRRRRRQGRIKNESFFDLVTTVASMSSDRISMTTVATNDFVFQTPSYQKKCFGCLFSIEIKNVDVNFLLLLITFSKPRMQKNIQNNKKASVLRISVPSMISFQSLPDKKM